MRAGTYVTPNLRLVEELGEGGMGSVWVAENESLHTQVAVKFISTELVDKDPSILERFQREASLAAKIRSPHVVQTFDHGVMDDGQPYIVMELLVGEDLTDRLDREGQLPLDECVEIIEQAARGLGRAHKETIVHRDIKPDNIFLEEDDDGFHVKLLDFGIAKQTAMPTVTNMTGTNMMIGTPDYMSPEQVMSAKHVDHGTDLWSLAVVAYQCITGTTPFEGETLGALSVAITSAQFVAPSELRPGLPRSVDDWFARALHKDPARRFESARELAETFARAVGGASVPGVAVSSTASQDTLPASARSIPEEEALPIPVRQRSRSLLLVAALVGAIAAASVTVALVGGDSDAGGVETAPAASASAPPSLAPPETEETASAARPEPTSAPEREPTDEPEPASSAAATGRVVPPPPPQQPVSSPPPPPPKPKPPPPPPPSVKDRGF